MAHIQDWNWNEYRVLPHRQVLDCSLYSVSGLLLRPAFEHVPCGISLTVDDIEANWCPHCAATINKAAKRRGEQARRAA